MILNLIDGLNLYIDSGNSIDESTLPDEEIMSSDGTFDAAEIQSYVTDDQFETFVMMGTVQVAFLGFIAGAILAKGLIKGW